MKKTTILVILAGAVMLASCSSYTCPTYSTAVTLIPFNAGQANSNYLGGALVLNSIFFLAAVHFWADRTRPIARRLFFASIIYLPLILGLMVFTKQ